MNKLALLSVLASIMVFFTATSSAQLSQERIAEIADLKVQRFQNILDLSRSQSNQLKTETTKLMVAQGSVATSGDILGQVNKNLDRYYSSLTTLKPQQLATLKLMDSMERESRRESYKDLLQAYGQTSDFAAEVATYNWDVVIPILVSFRKDLDRYITPADQAAIAEVRELMIAKYNFITSIRDNSPSVETESIVNTIQDELLLDINQSILPQLLKRYDEDIVEIRKELQKHENKISKDIKEIYAKYNLDSYQKQITEEREFVGMLGISNLLRNSFFLLLDGDSRTASFKINALQLMSSELDVTSQF